MAAQRAETKDAWHVVLESAHALCTLCNVLASMLECVDVQVWQSAAFQGITVEAIDSKHGASAVKAQLSGTVVHPRLQQCGGDANVDASAAAGARLGGCERVAAFRVSARTLAACLKSVPPHARLRIAARAGALASVRMTSSDDLLPAHTQCFVLPVSTCRHDPPMRLRECHFVYDIELEVSWLIRIARLCSHLSAETLSLRVVQAAPTDDGSATTAQRPAAKRPRPGPSPLILTFSGQGDCEYEHALRCDALERTGSAQRHDGALGVASWSVASEGWTALAGATLESVFSAEYAATAIERFLKQLDTPSVVLRLGDDQRLVLFHELARSSHVSFVIAPRDVD